MTPTRYSGTVNAYEWLASELRKRGVQASTERLEVQAAAIRERRTIDDRADLRQLKDFAVALRKARRALEVARSLWAMSPSSSNRQALAEATAARSEAHAQLLEACCQDEQLYSDVLKAVS